MGEARSTRQSIERFFPFLHSDFKGGRCFLVCFCSRSSWREEGERERSCLLFFSEHQIMLIRATVLLVVRTTISSEALVATGWSCTFQIAESSRKTEPVHWSILLREERATSSLTNFSLRFSSSSPQTSQLRADGHAFKNLESRGSLLHPRSWGGVPDGAQTACYLVEGGEVGSLRRKMFADFCGRFEEMLSASPTRWERHSTWGWTVETAMNYKRVLTESL